MHYCKDKIVKDLTTHASSALRIEKIEQSPDHLSTTNSTLLRPVPVSQALSKNPSLEETFRSN